MTTKISSQGKVALIAGASKGIGAGTALAFARAGYAVAIGARNLEALQSVASQIEAAGGQALAVKIDVGDAASVEQFVQRTVERFGRLDAAFNDATDGPRPALLADIDPEQFDVGIRANIRGTFLGMKYQIKAMLRTGGGTIINMASVAGMRGLARGDSITVVPIGKELTTQQAADLLNVSRQFLVRLLDEKRLPFCKTGKRRRLRIDDVLAFKERRDKERRAGLRELSQVTQEYGGYATESGAQRANPNPRVPG